MMVGGAASASAGAAAGGEATAAAGAYLSAKQRVIRLEGMKEEIVGRIDVENPSSRRTGQIHYQEGNDKYPATNEYTRPAPNRVNRLLEKEDVKRAIEKGERYLGR